MLGSSDPPAARRALRLTLTFLLATLALPAGAGAVSVTALPAGALATDRPVHATARLGNTIYLQGGFSRIGPYTGSGVALDPASGARDPRYAAVNGQVSDALPDGAGGWYLGGDFTEAGGLVRRNVAHLRADGRIDPVFRPAVDGFVDSLASDGTRLFVGGYFTHVDQLPRAGVAALDLRTGRAVSAFDARQAGQATELAYAPAAGGIPARLYVGMDQLLALDPATGRASPRFASDIQADIRALAVIGDRLYVGGDGLVALDAATGERDPGFRAAPRSLEDESVFDGTVHVLLPDGDRILAGGSFNALGGAAGPLVALDPRTGAADRRFTPQVSGSVYDVARIGGRMWVAGAFDSAGGVDATNLAVVDGDSGARDGDLAPRFDGPVYALAPGARLFAGGEFAIAGYSQRSGLAAVQATTGALDPTFGIATDVTNLQTGLSAGAGSLFLGQTRFSHDQRSPRARTRIEVVDARDGIRRDRPDFGPIHGLTGLAVDDDRIYFAQRLDRRLFPRTRVTVRSARSGRLLQRFEVPLRGYITKLEPSGARLFAAGSFKRRRADGRPANLAVIKLDSRTGELRGEFDPHVDGPVYDLTSSSRRLWLVGLFDVAGPEGAELRRPGFSAVAADTGAADRGFRPRVYGGSDSSLKLVDDDLFVYRVFRDRGFFVSGDDGALLDLPALRRRTTTFHAAEAAGRRVMVSATIPSGSTFHADAETSFVALVNDPP